jgi:hypothetical protein
MKQYILTSSVLAVSVAAAMAAAPRTATFEARHELKVTVPEGAYRVRIWFAMPQDDPLQQVKNFNIEAPIPHRVTTGFEGNKAVYPGSISLSLREMITTQSKEARYLVQFTNTRSTCKATCRKTNGQRCYRPPAIVRCGAPF